MSWRVDVQRPAENELKRVSPDARQRIIGTLRELQRMRFRLKRRSCRTATATEFASAIIASSTPDQVAHSIQVSAIGHRKEVYR